ncbi:MarR family transcriptional regulator [Streptomyces sp. PTM05]|uniref:MarR family transcriptional regulator n=1 Tax=Streptantibioticus parmotrematis TaxID=2873249 RepID=A0ABS7QQJ0_9ACTN|nr:MarR family transcriptional regulator [Streptantibioticus parmotrematis]MBY8885458.1 MarR family transcriptional regulator [Streptantibioticus parmotrematis]
MTTSGESSVTRAGLRAEIEDTLAYLTCSLVARRTRATPERVTWQQYDVLELLRLRGPMTPSLLSESLGVSRQTMSKALRILKDQELVEQSAQSADKREQTTSITMRGHEFLARAARGRRENAKVVEGALSAEEQAAFVELCGKVANALNVAPQPFPVRDL